MGPKPLLLPCWWGFCAGGDEDFSQQKELEPCGLWKWLTPTVQRSVVFGSTSAMGNLRDDSFYSKVSVWSLGIGGQLGYLSLVIGWLNVWLSGWTVRLGAVGFSSFSISKHIRFCDILLQFSFFLGINIYFTLKLSWFWHFILFVKFLDILHIFKHFVLSIR